MTALQLCPLCAQSQFTSEKLANKRVYSINCQNCGEFRVTEQALPLLSAQSLSDPERRILRGQTRLASKRGACLDLTTGSVSDIIRAAPILSNPLDVSDRILVEFSRAARPFSANVTVEADQSLDYFLPHVQDLYRILDALVERGYIKKFSQVAGRWTGAMEFAGWERVRDTERLIPDAWRAFVAMSFDASLDAAWTDGIRPALESTGYSAIRVDKVPHLGKIDDKIISELRMASIVIADFTLHRGGVYFEAGFALGRGVPVVWCCRKSDIEVSHFDTRQYNHVVWSEPSDLQEQLRVRLIATVPTRQAGGPVPSTA